MYDLKAYLPTTKKELQLRGWDEVDVILFSGDAYIDHPAFGAAVIGRVLEHAGYKVAIVPQPDWRGDHRDFTKLGKPRLFFAVTAGSMDSMVNHYTAAKRLRSDDAYTPEGKAGMRPDYCTITYCNILKKLYPDVPIVIGGIEASMRRLTHYDYWSNRLMPSILVDSKADILVYGMGEKQIVEIAKAIDRCAEDGRSLRLKMEDRCAEDIPQVAYLTDKLRGERQEAIVLQSHEEAVKSKRVHAENFRLIETESNKINAATIIQPVGERYVPRVSIPAILSSANSKNNELEWSLTRAESSRSVNMNSCEDNCLSSSDIASAIEPSAEVMRSILMFVIVLRFWGVIPA